jgi:hypothetical protein
MFLVLIAGILAVVFESLVLVANPAQVPLGFYKLSACFMAVWINPIFLVEQSIDEIQRGLEISCYNPIQVWCGI